MIFAEHEMGRRNLQRLVSAGELFLGRGKLGLPAGEEQVRTVSFGARQSRLSRRFPSVVLAVVLGCDPLEPGAERGNVRRADHAVVLGS